MACFPFKSSLRRNGLKYFILICWISGWLLLFYQTFCYYRDDPSFYYVHQILGVWVCISRGAASVINLNCGLILLPVCRYLLTSITKFNLKLKISSVRILLEACKGFHKACAITIIISSGLHVIGHIFNTMNFSQYYNSQYPEVNGADYPQQEPIYIILNSVSGITGVCMSLILIIIVTTSHKHIRDANYEVFYYAHRLIFLFYILLLVHAIKGPIKQQKNIDLHWPGCNNSDKLEVHVVPEPDPEYSSHYYLNKTLCTEPPRFQSIGCQSWLWILLPLLLYIFDSVIRISRRKSATVEDICAFHGDVFEMKLHCKGFRAIPGQYILLKCPEISIFEYHPYSITKCPDKTDDKMSIYIRHRGDWSGKLHSLFTTDKFIEDGRYLRCKLNIDGPYSSPLCRMGSCKVGVCISGGIGVTPFISLLHQLRINKGKLKKLYFIWIVRDLSNLTWCIEALRETYLQLWNQKHYMEPDILEIKLYITNRQSLVEQEYFSEDTLQFINHRMQLSRPDWFKLFSSLKSLHHGTLDVFVCGPKRLIHDVRRTTLRCESKNTKFQLYHEIF